MRRSLDMILFPERGKPPTVQIPGYEQVPGNPFQYKQVWLPCTHHEIKLSPCKGCKNPSQVHYCNELTIVTTADICNSCILRSESISSV